MALHTKGLFVMNGTKVVFDTCAVINLLDRICDPNSLGITIDELQLFTSIIVRIELLSKRDITADEELDVLEFLEGLTVIPINEEIEDMAIKLRRSTSLKLPDSIVAATSIVLDALLLTYDKHLLNLSWPGYKAKAII